MQHRVAHGINPAQVGLLSAVRCSSGTIDRWGVFCFETCLSKFWIILRCEGDVNLCWYMLIWWQCNLTDPFFRARITWNFTQRSAACPNRRVMTWCRSKNWWRRGQFQCAMSRGCGGFITRLQARQARNWKRNFATSHMGIDLKVLAGNVVDDGSNVIKWGFAKVIFWVGESFFCKSCSRKTISEVIF